MATTGNGLTPLRKIDGGQLRINRYAVLASDGTALYRGDVVKLANGVDTVSQLNTITKAASGNVLLGVVVGFLPDPTDPLKGTRRAASTYRIVYVCDDPDAVYALQEDAVSGAVAAASIGAMDNANLNVVAGSDNTMMSGTMLQSSSVTTSAADVKIIGVLTVPNNLAAQTAGAILEVMILAPAIKATNSG